MATALNVSSDVEHLWLFDEMLYYCNLLYYAAMLNITNDNTV